MPPRRRLPRQVSRRHVEAWLSELTASETLGFADRSGAWRAVQAALARREVQAVDDYRADLTLVQERVWRRAMVGDLEAGRIVMRAIEARCRVLGL